MNGLRLPHARELLPRTTASNGGYGWKADASNHKAFKVDDAVTQFKSLLYDRLIPEFCSDPGRRFELAGFQRESVKVSEEDARYFLLAFNAGLVEHCGGGNYKCPQSACIERFLWEGRRASDPRRYTLSLEPVISVAGLARLHFDYGWPAELIATQSSDYALDLVAFLPGAPSEFIAGEVKKTRRELERLVELMMLFGRDATAGLPPSAKQEERNAYKKIAALRSRQPPSFWALGPDGLSRVFKVNYSAGEFVDLVKVAEDALKFPAVANANG